jgi:hypothetical protein
VRRDRSSRRRRYVCISDESACDKSRLMKKKQQREPRIAQQCIDE